MFNGGIQYITKFQSLVEGNCVPLKSAFLKSKIIYCLLLENFKPKHQAIQLLQRFDKELTITHIASDTSFTSHRASY